MKVKIFLSTIFVVFMGSFILYEEVFAMDDNTSQAGISFSENENTDNNDSIKGGQTENKKVSSLEYGTKKENIYLPSTGQFQKKYGLISFAFLVSALGLFLLNKKEYRNKFNMNGENYEKINENEYCWIRFDNDYWYWKYSFRC